MARQDRPYFKIQHEFFFGDPRFAKLTCGQKLTYLTVWALAVEQRCTTLRPEIDARYIADRSHLDIRSVRNGLQKCSTIGGKNALITINNDNSITVNGVRSVHNSLRDWTDPIRSNDLTQTGPKLHIEQNRTEQNSTTPPIIPLSGTHTPEEKHTGMLRLEQEHGNAISKDAKLEALIELWSSRYRKKHGRFYPVQKWDRNEIKKQLAVANYRELSESMIRYWEIKELKDNNGALKDTVTEWLEEAVNNFEDILPYEVKLK